MSVNEEHKLISSEVILLLKHDIKNQLSNIHLALEGLKFEGKDGDTDCKLYMDSLEQSAKKIDVLLNSIDL